MTDEQVVERRERRVNAAIGSSSPDVNHLAMSLIRRFLRLEKWYATAFAAFLAMLWKIAVIGVPAMIAGALLIDKWQTGTSLEREHELKMFSLQTDVELKKLDKTIVGEGALKTLAAISTKLDEQKEATQQMRMEVQTVSSKVEALGVAQSKTESRVSGLAASQKQLQDRVNQRPE